MTHSGQGDEQRLPAARPAHEGVVLPADGSEPLIPGAPGAQAAPAGGQPWGEPWGPQQPAPQAPQAQPGGYGYPGGEAQPGYGYPGGQAPQGQGYPGGQAQPGGYGYPGGQVQPGYGYPGGQAPQGQGYPGGQAQPGGYGYPGDRPPQEPRPQHGVHAQPLPQPGAPAGAYGQSPHAPQGAPQQGQFPHGAPASAAPAGALPPQASQAPQAATPQGQFPQNAYTQQAPQGGALPPQQGLGLPPQGPAGTADSAATQYIPPVASGAPATPGVLPPEMPAESTTFLGTGPLGQGGGSRQGGPQGSDADATQYIAPVPGGGAPGAVPPAPAGAPFGIRPGAPGDRQPPAEFDSLFRSEGAGPQPADATQQMPRFGEQPPAPGHQQARYEPQYDPEHEPRRRSTAPVVAALVIGCAVLGLGVGAVMFSGGGDDKEDPGPDKNVAAGSPAPSETAPATQPADPAEPQAKELDKLLADSNNSRAAVIRSVENIKVCKNLDQAAADLKGAAQQRRGLVTRLGALSVDKLPNHAALTASLTKAWQASASADDHYAAWAEQVKGKKGCKGGKARATAQTVQANKASGEATKAKNEASPLWNSIARKYSLTERRSDQL
ncbi:hypothetical protein ACIQ7Q_16440 [Streptomyces sp. NPDC096176]|uniref:hypothetical protein n=1 Tax=Streptomyces sp. NPDC096176 TaxID=3366079 RepID=UPI003813CD52